MQARSIAERIEQKRQLGESEKAVVDGLRHPEDILWLKKNLRAKIIGVTASSDIRFQRLITRARFSDPTAKVLFDNADAIDMGVGQPPEGDNITQCLELADTVIENVGSKESLHRKVEELLISFGIEGNPRYHERC